MRIEIRRTIGEIDNTVDIECESLSMLDVYNLIRMMNYIEMLDGNIETLKDVNIK